MQKIVGEGQGDRKGGGFTLFPRCFERKKKVPGRSADRTGTLCADSLGRHFCSHDVHEEFARVAHGFLEGLAAPSQFRRDGAKFPHGGPSGRPAGGVDFASQLWEIPQRRQPSRRAVRVVAARTSLAEGGRDVAAVAKLAGGPLVPQDAPSTPAPGGWVRPAAAAAAAC